VTLRAGSLDRSLRVERKVSDEAFDSAGSETWETVINDVRANVRDMLPSRGERLAEGLSTLTRPARVRMRERADITADMRFVIRARRRGETDRVVQIVSGPAIVETGGIEFMVEEYRPAGGV
jgi:head-tail adaptor